MTFVVCTHSYVGMESLVLQYTHDRCPLITKSAAVLGRYYPCPPVTH